MTTTDFDDYPNTPLGRNEYHTLDKGELYKNPMYNLRYPSADYYVHDVHFYYYVTDVPIH